MYAADRCDTDPYGLPQPKNHHPQFAPSPPWQIDRLVGYMTAQPPQSPNIAV